MWNLAYVCSWHVYVCGVDLVGLCVCGELWEGMEVSPCGAWHVYVPHGVIYGME